VEPGISEWFRLKLRFCVLASVFLLPHEQHTRTDRNGYLSICGHRCHLFTHARPSGANHAKARVTAKIREEQGCYFRGSVPSGLRRRVEKRPPLPQCRANLKASQQSESVPFWNTRVLAFWRHQGWRRPKCGQFLMVRPSFRRCVKPDSHAGTGVARFSSGSCSRGGCARCRLAAQAVPVNESIGRGARDSSNRGLSR